ncbi:hypothetical protein BGX26_008063 [Mortierella sp. AD094]|nr:hypothetical protein BGX26_008063 [Mortierella sp. AD094]
MGQHIGRKGVGIGVGYFVKVFQLSRSIWCSLDRRSLEAMHQVFPSISTLHVLDEVELGGVDPQELRGIPGDSLNTPYDCMDRCNTKARDQCQVYTTEDQVSQLCLQFEDLVSPRQLPPVQKIEDSLQNLARWFPRLEDPVLPERGLMASAADINSSGPGGKKRTLLESKVTKQGSLKEEPRHTIDINSNMINITGLDYSVNEQKDHHRDYMKRVRLSDQLDTQISRQIFSSTHPGPWLLQDCSPGNGITAHAAQFRNLAHVSCPFESIGLLSLDLILNQMSMPCLVSVEIRARPSLIYTVLAQSQGLCLDLGDAGTKSPLTQSIDLMRKALGRGCTRDLQQIDVPDIVEYGHGYGDCECQCYHGVLESEYHSMAVREITERHSSTLRRLSLWRDGLSRDISMP